ncbi:ABC transporter permease [uncultured Subdoligranulum sp.]|uniref:ABC transporter permease n=1 Tax=uncultured Subdoligranulum sp. TaxID=512298 RepID=UPI0026045009|nr:ABC transporter permease [uncultured Subdoligranulum sp.]
MNFTYRPTPISAKTAIMAILFGILVGAVLILATGNDPLEIYAALIRGACGSTFSLASSIRWTIPLIFAGTAASIAFKGGVFNMGVEGQMYMGGLAAAIIGVTCTDLPAPVLIPLMLVSSMLVGMIWALPPILAKVFFGSSEVVPCMMLNYVAMYLTDYLVHNVFLASGNRGATIKTDMIAEQGRLATLISGTSVSTALIIALVVVGLYWVLIRKTKLGYEFEICGINPRFAKYGGVNVLASRIGVILLSGAIAGLGGATEIMGVRYCFESRFVGDFATNGILSSLLGSCSPIGTLIGSIFMGFLKAGSLTVERTTSVSRAVAVVIQCTIICFVSAKAFAHLLDRVKLPGKLAKQGGLEHES